MVKTENDDDAADVAVVLSYDVNFRQG